MTGDKKGGMCLAAHMACLCLLGLVGGGLWPLPAYSQQRPPPLPVVVGTVVEQAVVTEIEVVGTVEPHLATTLSTEIAGLTLRFDLREGDSVQQGKTVVVQLKATDLELALAEAEAELARARETARKLKRGLRPEEIEEKRAEVQERQTWVAKYTKDLERAKSLQNTRAMSASDYDLAEGRTWPPKRNTRVPCNHCGWLNSVADRRTLQRRKPRCNAWRSGPNGCVRISRKPPFARRCQGLLRSAIPKLANGSNGAAKWSIWWIYGWSSSVCRSTKRT